MFTMASQKKRRRKSEMLVNHLETEECIVKIVPSRDNQRLRTLRMPLLFWPSLTVSMLKRGFAALSGVMLVCMLFGSVAFGQEQDAARKQYSEKIASGDSNEPSPQPSAQAGGLHGSVAGG